MRLLESEAAPGRRQGGTMTSMVVHVALIAGAVAASARQAPVIEDVLILPEYVYQAPLPERPHRPAPSTGGGTGTTRAPGPVIAAPSTVRDGLPPIHLDIDVPVGTQPQVTLGGASSGAMEGGFGGSPSGRYGADPSGTWDARTVEVPVVPDARNPSPTYPEMLRTAGMTGRVVAEFVVDSTGRVRAGSFVIVEATHDLFASSVRRTVPSFRFTPARVQGRRVAQRVRVPFEFEIGR